MIQLCRESCRNVVHQCVCNKTILLYLQSKPQATSSNTKEKQREEESSMRDRKPQNVLSHAWSPCRAKVACWSSTILPSPESPSSLHHQYNCVVHEFLLQIYWENIRCLRRGRVTPFLCTRSFPCPHGKEVGFSVLPEWAGIHQLSLSLNFCFCFSIQRRTLKLVIRSFFSSVHFYCVLFQKGIDRSSTISLFVNANKVNLCLDITNCHLPRKRVATIVAEPLERCRLQPIRVGHFCTRSHWIHPMQAAALGVVNSRQMAALFVGSRSVTHTLWPNVLKEIFLSGAKFSYHLVQIFLSGTKFSSEILSSENLHQMIRKFGAR